MLGLWPLAGVCGEFSDSVCGQFSAGVSGEFSASVCGKLDGVGPVDNRPSTNQLHQFVQIFLRIIFSLCKKNVFLIKKKIFSHMNVTRDT